MKRLLGKYELLARLATGGMAEVYLARERGIAGLERFVVIKRMLPQIEQSQAHIDMFLREARFIARLNHPNIVQIYELSETEGSYFFAMEFVDGVSVAELMQIVHAEGERVPLEVAVELISQACRGAHAAHETRDLDGQLIGLVHRDMTPHNLMCTVDGHVKLLDFGVAKASRGADTTNSGSIKGKYTYMSPEQALSQDLDRRSDVFALGVILWELCTGQYLFSRDSVLLSLNAIANGEVQAPSEVNEGLPEKVEAVILRALERAPEDRFASAEALRKALMEAVGESELESHPEALAGFIGDVAGDKLRERRGLLQQRLERAATDSTFDLPGIAPADELPLLDAGLGATMTSGSLPRLERASLFSESKRPAGGLGAPLATGADIAEVLTADSPVVGELPHAPTDELELPTEALERIEKSHEASATSWKRLVLVVLLLLVAAVCFLVLSSLEEGEDEGEAVVGGEPVVVGWPPLLDAEVLLEDVRPIHDYLEATLGRPIKAVVSPNYDALTVWMEEGEVDFAILPPLLYVRSKEKAPGIALLAFKEFDGAVASNAMLLVRMESRYQTLEELEGKRVCYTDRSSTSGYMMARAYMRKAGYDPDAFVGGVQWSGNHFQVLRDLLEGRCEFAATFSSSVLPADHYDITVGQLRTLVITGVIPEDSVCASPGTSPELVSAMREALLAFDPKRDSGERRVSKTQRVTGFVKAEDSRFEDVRAAVKLAE